MEETVDQVPESEQLTGSSLDESFEQRNSVQILVSAVKTRLQFLKNKLSMAPITDRK